MGNYIGFPDFNDVMDYESEFDDNDWKKYPLETFVDKFFSEYDKISVENNFDIYLGGSTVEPQDNFRVKLSKDEIHRVIEGYVYSYNDKNQNSKYDKGEPAYAPHISLKLFISTDGAWLLETAKRLENRVSNNTLVVFLEVNDAEHTDSISETVLLCIGGQSAAKYMNDPKVAEFYGSHVTISKDTLQSLIKNIGDKNAFQAAIKATLHGFGDIIAWLPGQVGGWLSDIGEELESWKIDQATWDKDRTTPILEAAKDFREGILARLDEIIRTKSLDMDAVSLPIPDSVISMLKSVRDICNLVLRAMDEFIKSAGNVLEFAFALICGILNGLLDLIAGLFSFVGLILQAIAGTVKGVAKGAADPDYYLALLLEYLDNGLQAIQKIDWGKVMETIKNWLEKILAAIDPAALLAKLKVSRRQLGYYIGYIGINVLACFVGVGEVAALMRLKKLEGPLAAIVDAVGDVVGKLPAGDKLTVEVLFGILKSYVTVLVKGTVEVINLINKIFEKLLQWLYSLTREIFYLMIGSQRFAFSLVPPALVIQLLADLATIFVRRNLDNLGLKVFETEGRYIIKYGEQVMYVTDKNGMRRYINEKLDMEEAVAKKRLDEEVKLLAALERRIAYMEKHWIDYTGTKGPYGRHELETLANAEVRYSSEFRPSKQGEVGDAIALSGKWKDKSFDAWGPPKSAFSKDSWIHTYKKMLNRMFKKLDRHFDKLDPIEPDKRALDKLILDLKGLPPDIREAALKHIQEKYSRHLSSDAVDIIN